MTIFIPKTRCEFHQKIKDGISCLMPKKLSRYNRIMVNFWVKKYGYKKSDSEIKEMDFYEKLNN
jgi:hypothetical protein